MDRYERTRKSIISMFESLCIFGAYATVIGGIVVAVVMVRQGLHPVLAILVAIAAYMSAALIFGGALVLVDIARSLERLVAVQPPDINIAPEQ